MIAHRHFVSKIPKSYPLEKAGPCFCAGVTMFAPLKEYGAMQGGKTVGIAGFGGLGQMGLLLAKAMGNSVSIISSSPKKESMAKAMGADKFIVSKDPDAMKQAVKSLDLILDTISASHDIQPNLELLKKKGTYVVLGLCFQPLQVKAIKLLLDQVKITGSSVGGMKITQECINFVAEKNLQVETKMLTSIAQVSEAEKALQQGNDSGVRYVIDMQKALS